ncbi:LLM class flavin-dependent oxidoreductase [Natrialba swarupiae]|uniref:LLM class flavin-dependent oxidoreductase n=1 Tax=Natrialba swarupiae TaxID=2448032 RepID=A0A5D5AHN2_9EURY|nr:LLM class flavin-dependent oxidoreductase [Natrialba swarupiae]
MDLSIVDVAPVRAGESATDAYENTTELAGLAERLGYSRYWVAEHHGMGESIASTTPEVLIGHLAAETSSIRVGSGTVLLNHYALTKVPKNSAQTRVPSTVTGMLLPGTLRPIETPTEETPSSSG